MLAGKWRQYHPREKTSSRGVGRVQREFEEKGLEDELEEAERSTETTDSTRSERRRTEAVTLWTACTPAVGRRRG
jgi:ferric-dicitrate binding protein FerR (iron transport regulator)